LRKGGKKRKRRKGTDGLDSPHHHLEELGAVEPQISQNLRGKRRRRIRPRVVHECPSATMYLQQKQRHSAGRKEGEKRQPCRGSKNRPCRSSTSSAGTLGRGREKKAENQHCRKKPPLPAIARKKEGKKTSTAPQRRDPKPHRPSIE